MPTSDPPENSVEAAAQRVVELEAELEVSGDAMTADAELAFIRAALHEWADSVVGAVASPGVGRVTLIHANGSQSKIASPELPYRLSRPVRFG
jgi:hypothetical protein